MTEKARLAPGFDGRKVVRIDMLFGGQTSKPDWRVSASAAPQVLLGCHLFRFAFLAHKLQFALGGFDLGGDFLLYAGCRFFELR